LPSGSFATGLVNLFSPAFGGAVLSFAAPDFLKFAIAQHSVGVSD